MAKLAEALICLVVGIADGDTLTARCGHEGAYEQVKARIAAIDAPERKQPFGRASRQSLADLCFGTDARISVRDTDRYGRIVADVKCRGKDAATEQVRSGMAWVYDKYDKGYSYLYPLQSAAQKAKSGLWRDLGTKVPPVAPWEWRRGRAGRVKTTLRAAPRG